jgi:hypothetical protein
MARTIVAPLTTTTVSLQITKVSVSSLGLLVLSIKGPPFASPLFLGVIAVKATSAITDLNGTIKVGTATQAGKASLYAGLALYQSLVDIATTPGKHVAELTYETLSEMPIALSIMLLGA